MNAHKASPPVEAVAVPLRREIAKHAFRPVYSKLGSVAAACVLLFTTVAPSLADEGPPIMSLPGQFNVNQSGAATYSIPISVPPGTGGMVPSLSLNYSSQNGDGVVGLGWMLSGLPSIGRCPRTLAQDTDTTTTPNAPIHGSVNFDSGDRYCLDGQRLVAISGTYGADGTVYRTEIESFSKIVSYGSAGSGPLYFKVWTKAGQIMEFGGGANSRALVLTSGKSEVRVWSVSKISDTMTNYLTVTYNDENGTDRTVNGEIYPTRIDYTGNSNASLATYNYVTFGYNFARPDTSVSFQAGSYLKSTALLNEVKTYSSGTLVYDYKLDYGTTGTATAHSELQSVTLYDSAGAHLKPTTFQWRGTRDVVTVTQSTTTPPTNGKVVQSIALPGDFNGDGVTDILPWPADTETYACDVYLGQQNSFSFQPGGYTAQYRYGYYDPSGGGHIAWFTDHICFQFATPSPAFSTLDVDGDGFSDLTFEAADGYFNSTPGRSFLLNTKAGALNSFDGPPWPEPTIVGYPVGQVGDFNGDGRGDFYGGGLTSYFYLSNGTPSPGIAGIGPGAIFSTQIPADFDGDGCSDLLVQGSGFNSLIYYSSLFCKPATPNVGVTNWTAQGYSIAFGDFNGDGKTDVLRTANDDPAQLFLSTGISVVNSGWNGVTVGPGGVNINFSKYAIYPGDFNGDGMTDLFLVADGVQHGTVHHYDTGGAAYILLSTGTGFVLAATIPAVGNSGDGATGDIPALRAVVADWNSDGAADILILKPSGDQFFTVAFTPEQIVSVSNGLGATTSIKYDRLNQNGGVYSKCGTTSLDCGDAYPTQAMDGPLYVVTEVDTTTGLSDGSLYKSKYSYKQAKLDLNGRGFLGFGQMTVTDLMTHLIQTTNYSTNFPTTGLIVSQTKTCPVGVCGTGAAPLSSLTNTYDVLDLGAGSEASDQVHRKFVSVKQSVAMGHDTDGSLLPTVTMDYVYDCDFQDFCAGNTPTGYGNARTVTQTTAMPNGSDSSTKTTTSTYDNDTTYGHWFLGRVRTAQVDSVIAADGVHIVRKSAYSYDTGTAGSTGLLLSETVEPNNNTCNSDGAGNGTPIACKLETIYGYDGFGNKTSAQTTGLAAVLSSGSQVLQATTRFTGTTYYDVVNDPNSRFPYKVTNALGESEFWFHANKFGLVSKQTGPNGMSSTWSYDTFGRKTQEHRVDGTETQFDYEFCSASGGTITTCPTDAVFAVITMPTEKSVNGVPGPQIGPQSITYYDSLYRVLAADAQGFAGNWIRSATLYDPLGRVLQKSRPYFRDQQNVSIYWTINTSFDVLGRVLTATTPYYAGSTLTTSLTTFVYDGRKSSTTLHIVRPDGSTTDQTTSTTKDARGKVVVVKNALNKSTTYDYDAVGDLTTVTDPAGNITTYIYDVRGNKIVAKDPDMGIWHYSYDAFGQLYQQTDAKNQTSTLSYDDLGRALERTEADLVSKWTYGTDPAQHNVDKLVTACTGACNASTDYVRSLTYDLNGKPKTVTLNINGSAAVYTMVHDLDTGRVTSLTYPSSLKVRYNYDTTLGYLLNIADFSSGKVYWAANARDAELHLTSATAGDGMTMVDVYDPATGLVQKIDASTPSGSNDLANYLYAFDSNATLMSRTDKIGDGTTPYKENFCYDALNRLTNSAISGINSTDCTTGRAGQVKSVAYDDVGNITTKSFTGTDSGTYGYSTAGGAPGSHPHAVTSITGTVNGNINPQYLYDANGNLTCEFTGPSNCNLSGGIIETTTWTSFNMVALVMQGTTSIGLGYDSEHSRITQHVVTSGTTTDTTYLNDPMSGAMEEKVVSGSTTIWHDYLMADGRMVAEHFKNGSAQNWDYFVLDSLGSVSVITTDDGLGNPILVANGHQSYDTWGRQRNADGSDDTTCTKPASSTTTRGFTGQEMMPAVCLINFNARVYDPTLGKFLSPDTVTQNQFDLQTLNRYSYCGNNPLSFTDPSGNLFGIDDVIVAAAVALAVTAVIAPKLALQLLPVFAAFACGPLGPVCAGAAAGAVAGIQGGDATQVLFAFVLTMSSAGALQGIGGAPGPLVGKAITAGVVGGAFSVLGGGHFASGFLAAGFSTLTAPLVGDVAGTSRLAGTAISAVLGGAASVLGGGKFANGAATGAFVYLASTPAESDQVDEDVSVLGVELIRKGIDPDNTSVPAGLLDVMHKVEQMPGFQEDAREIYDSSVATSVANGGKNAEVRGIFVQRLANGTINISEYVGQPTPCSLSASSCMMPPKPDPAKGELIFDWHPHPDATSGARVPSGADLIRSKTLHIPGLIWAVPGQPGGPPVVVPYMAHGFPIKP